MRQVWLRGNQRAILVAMVPTAALIALGAYLVEPGREGALRYAGWGALAIGWIGILVQAWHLWRPRVACDGKHLMLYLNAGGPERVPLEWVEAFLLTQALAAPGKSEKRVAAIAVKISEKAEEWQKRDVNAALGQWCGGQVTIRGTWCEPLSVGLAQRLNDRLVAAQQALKTEAKR